MQSRERHTAPTLSTRLPMIPPSRNSHIPFVLLCTCGECGSVLLPRDEVEAMGISSRSPSEKLVCVALMSRAISKCSSCGYDCESDITIIMNNALSEGDVVRRLNLVSEEDAQLLGSPMRAPLGNITNNK